MIEQVLLLLQEIKEKQKPSGAWPRPGQWSLWETRHQCRIKHLEHLQKYSLTILTFCIQRGSWKFVRSVTLTKKYM